jgi:hypothetical protein
MASSARLTRCGGLRAVRNIFTDPPSGKAGAGNQTSDPLPNGLELSYPAEAGNSSLLYGTPEGQASSNRRPARRVSFSELLGVAAEARKIATSLDRQNEL